MASFNSDLVAAGASANYSDKCIDSDRTTGLLLLATVQVLVKTAHASDDTIQLVDLPVGAVVVPSLCTLVAEDPGTTYTLKVGDAGDTDRYMAATDVKAGGVFNFCSTAPTTLPAAAHTPYRATETLRVYATLTSVGTPTDGAKLVFTIAYRIKG